MKVSDLIEFLQGCEPDADVYLMMQQPWPFECAVIGATTRGAILETADDDEYPDHGQLAFENVDEPSADPPPAHDRWSAAETRLPRTDVFLVEGQQLRYGNSDAWEVAGK